jgi:hypothetical protein
MTGGICAFLWLTTWLRVVVAVVLVIYDFWMVSDCCLMYGLAVITAFSFWYYVAIYFTILRCVI